MSGTSDRNWKSYVDEVGLTVDPDNFVPCQDPENYDDIVKFSRCSNVRINGLNLAGGKEDCLDAVRGTEYRISECWFKPLNRAITLKGSISGYRIENSRFIRGKDCDIEIGQFDNYWFPGRAPTRHGQIINCICTDGPLRVKLWNADMPIIEGGNVVVSRVPWVIWFPYFLSQYLWVRLKGLKTS